LQRLFKGGGVVGGEVAGGGEEEVGEEGKEAEVLFVRVFASFYKLFKGRRKSPPPPPHPLPPLTPFFREDGTRCPGAQGGSRSVELDSSPLLD
jgi:hypothetical protein